MSGFADTAVRWISRVAAIIAMIGMALLVILFVASIVTRFIGITIPAVDDIGSVLLAAVFAFGLAAAVGANEHLSITLLVDRLPEGPRWYLLRFTELATIAVTSYLFVGIYHLFTAAVRSNQKMLGALPIPRYVPMSLVVIGVGLFVLALTFAFIRNISSRDPAVSAER